MEDPAVGESPQADALETLVSSIASTLPVSKIYPLSRRIETIRMLKSSSVIRMAVLLVFDRPTTSAVVPRQTGDRHAERTSFFCSGSLPAVMQLVLWYQDRLATGRLKEQVSFAACPSQSAPQI